MTDRDHRIAIASHIANHGGPDESRRAIDRLRAYGEDVSMYRAQPAPVPRDPTAADRLAEEVLP
jgi:plasmid stabilization system protein ParE